MTTEITATTIDVTTTAPTRLGRRSTLRASGGLQALLFALPLLLVFGLFSWWPIVSAVLMSLQKTNLVDPPTWVGLRNFRTVLSDPLLPKVIGNTVEFALLALVFGYPLPLAGAVLMSELRRHKPLYSVLVYLPVVVPPVVVVLLWKVFYDPRPQGVFNTVLGWVGLGPLSFLADAGQAMPSLVLAATWSAAGGTVIIYLAALISVPAELYDAAETDGASVWDKIVHVTLPQLRGVLLVTFILQIIATAQVFLEPFLFTNGGPDHATETVMLRVYDLAFANLGNNFGEATALSLMLAAVLALLSLIYFRVTRAWSSS